MTMETTTMGYIEFTVEGFLGWPPEAKLLEAHCVPVQLAAVFLEPP